jgi:hypothetical protein
MSLRVRVAIAVWLTLFPGCVSVYVDSTPKDAQVFVDGEQIGKTPTRFKAKTMLWCSYEVVVHKQGYTDAKAYVESEWNPYLFMGLVVGILLMPWLGNVNPRGIHAVLEPDYSQTPPPSVGDSPR